MMEQSRAFLQSLGLPGEDREDLPSSGKTFPGGAHFGIEVPTVNSAAALRALLEEAAAQDVAINRVDETFGAFRHTLAELREYAAVCRDAGVALTMSIGPRAAYDLSPSRLSDQGRFLGYRLRGTEQLVRALEDAQRICETGIRGILVYDEGLLWVLDRARKRGVLPEGLALKCSAHTGHGNPASLRLLQDLGADSINPVRDLPLPVLAALREAVEVPLDIHTDCPPSSGGFIRVYEAPEMVRCCAPVYLKTGNSCLRAHGELPTAEEARAMARQAGIVTEMVRRYAPWAQQLGPGQARPQVRD